MITVKDYAENKGVSTQAVYKQIKTHQEALEGHITKVQGKKWLDDFAVEYLDSKSDNNAVVVVQENQHERIKELEEENKRLRINLENMQQQLIDSQHALLEHKDKILELTEENNGYLIEVTELQAKQEKLEQKPTFWQRLKGKK